jgi:hypothetical protein
METASGFGSSAANPIVDVAASTHRARRRYFRVTDALCLTIEPKGAAPNDFKREPVIVKRLENGRLAEYLLLCEGPDPLVHKQGTRFQRLDSTEFYSKPRPGSQALNLEAASCRFTLSSLV